MFKLDENTKKYLRLMLGLNTVLQAAKTNGKNVPPEVPDTERKKLLKELKSLKTIVNTKKHKDTFNTFTTAANDLSTILNATENPITLGDLTAEDKETFLTENQYQRLVTQLSIFHLCGKAINEDSKFVKKCFTALRKCTAYRFQYLPTHGLAALIEESETIISNAKIRHDAEVKFEQRMPLREAVKRGNLDRVKYILANPQANGKLDLLEPINIAISRLDDPAIAFLLIDAGAPLDNALLLAANKPPALAHKLFRKLLSQERLKESPDLNRQNYNQSTALHIMVQNGDEQGARMLLEAGASPDVQNRDGNTPMHLAVKDEDTQKNRTIYQLLANFNASLHIKNKGNHTPKALASFFHNAAYRDLQHGGHVDKIVQQEGNKDFRPLLGLENRLEELRKAKLQAMEGTITDYLSKEKESRKKSHKTRKFSILDRKALEEQNSEHLGFLFTFYCERTKGVERANSLLQKKHEKGYLSDEQLAAHQTRLEKEHAELRQRIGGLPIEDLDMLIEKTTYQFIQSNKDAIKDKTVSDRNRQTRRNVLFRDLLGKLQILEKEYQRFELTALGRNPEAYTINFWLNQEDVAALTLEGQERPTTPIPKTTSPSPSPTKEETSESEEEEENLSLRDAVIKGRIDRVRALLPTVSRDELEQEDVDQDYANLVEIAIVENHIDIALLLIDAGVPIKDALTFVVFIPAEQAEKAVDKLLPKILDIDKPFKFRRNLDSKIEWFEHKYILHGIDGGNTALHCAVLQGNETLTRKLLEAGASPNTQNCKGQTPMHLALREKQTNIKCARALADHGASGNIKSHYPDQMTPLQLAAKYHNDDFSDIEFRISVAQRRQARATTTSRQHPSLPTLETAKPVETVTRRTTYPTTLPNTSQTTTTRAETARWQMTVPRSPTDSTSGAENARRQMAELIRRTTVKRNGNDIVK